MSSTEAPNFAQNRIFKMTDPSDAINGPFKTKDLVSIILEDMDSVAYKITNFGNFKQIYLVLELSRQCLLLTSVYSRFPEEERPGSSSGYL